MGEVVAASDNADLKFYMGRVRDPRVYVERCRDGGELLGLSSASRLLDIGCGFGWHAICTSLLFGCEVVANDIRPIMTEGVDASVAALRERGLHAKVTSHLGDICSAGDQLQTDGFTAIASHQTIEHVRDLPTMWAECRRLLSPGGRLLITNDNNLCNDDKVREALEQWERRDGDWDYINELKSRKPEEMQGIEPYRETRSRMIREVRDDLDDESVAKLAKATAGLVEADIREIGLNFKTDVDLPEPPKWSWCRDPETGEYVERLLDPFQLRDDIKAAGFDRCEVRLPFRRQPLRLMNGVTIDAFQKLIFKKKADFLLLAS